jgi:hypothetical protein
MYIPDPWDPQIKFKPGVNNPPKTAGSGVKKIRFKPGVEQIRFKPGVNPSSGGNQGQIRFKPGVPSTSAPASSSFRKAGSALTSGGSGAGLLGTLSLTSTLTPMLYGAMTTTRDALATDRGEAFKQNIMSGNYGQALSHLTGAYDRTPGLTPVLPNDSGKNPFLKKDGVITVTGADGVPVQLNMNNPADVARLQSIEQKVNPITIPTGDADDDGNSPPTNNPPVAPPSPTRSNMAEKTELERMTAFVKANKKLAEKVKPGQAGYEEIQIALGRMPSMPDEVQTFKSTDEGVTDPTESAKALGIEKLYDAQTNPQAFLSSRLAGDVKSDFSEALTSKTIMPEGEQLGVATDVPEDLFTRDITPQLQSAFLKKPLVKGMSLNTGARN